MCPVYAMPTRPSPRSERLGTPNTPAIRFTRGPFFEASLVRVCYGLSGCSPPWTDLTEFPQPPGAFTSRLPTGRSPFPSLDMTTTATGLLCWRDFHPQEWQLASLHQTRRAIAEGSDHSGQLVPRDRRCSVTVAAIGPGRGLRQFSRDESRRMNLNDDVVYRCLRLGSIHQLHSGRSSSLVRHHDRFHRPSPCVWYVVIFRIPLRTIENTARNSMVQ